MRLKFKIVFVAAIVCLAIVSILAGFSLVRLRAVVELRKQASAAQTALDDVLESIQSAQIARLEHDDTTFNKNLRAARANFDRFTRNPSIEELGLLEPVARLKKLFSDDPLHEELAPQIDLVDARLGHSVQVHQSVVDKYFGLSMGAVILFLLFALALLFTFARSVADEMRRRGRLEADLRAARADAISASELKSQFVATVSHEIRTPLNGILGMAEILANRVETEDLRRYVEVLRQSARRLVSLLNDVLNFSKLDSNQSSLVTQNVDPAQIIESTRTLFASTAEAKGLELSVEIDPALRRLFSADATRLAQVLQNLVANAIKFTDQGRVLIKGQLTEVPSLRFAVHDTGCGFGIEESRLLFQPFNQLPNARERGGTGLGLTISKRLVEQMNGTIEFTSQPRQGSQFWFSVPIRAPGPAHTVLLVEDDATNRLVARELLEQAHCKVVEACDGQDALAKFAPETFSLVLMDCRMPRMDGLTASRKLRAIERAELANPTPIIAMTADADPANRQRCLSAGMDDFITKPVDARPFRALLERTLIYHEAFQLDQLNSRVKPAVATRVVTSLRQTLNQLIPRLEHHASYEEWREMGAIAHQLKVSAHIVGARRFADSCEKIEHAVNFNNRPGADQVLCLLARANRLLAALAENSGEEAVTRAHDRIDL